MLDYVPWLLCRWTNRNCNKLSLALFLDSFDIEAPFSFICKGWLCDHRSSSPELKNCVFTTCDWSKLILTYLIQPSSKLVFFYFVRLFDHSCGTLIIYWARLLSLFLQGHFGWHFSNGLSSSPKPTFIHLKALDFSQMYARNL